MRDGRRKSDSGCGDGSSVEESLHRVLAGRGSGLRCAHCDELITAAEVEYELLEPGEGCRFGSAAIVGPTSPAVLRTMACHSWTLIRRAGRRRDPHSTGREAAHVANGTRAEAGPARSSEAEFVHQVREGSAS
jgi:hypothetical protein